MSSRLPTPATGMSRQGVDNEDEDDLGFLDATGCSRSWPRPRHARAGGGVSGLPGQTRRAGVIGQRSASVGCFIRRKGGRRKELPAHRRWSTAAGKGAAKRCCVVCVRVGGWVDECGLCEHRVNVIWKTEARSVAVLIAPIHLAQNVTPPKSFGGEMGTQVLITTLCVTYTRTGRPGHHGPTPARLREPLAPTSDHGVGRPCLLCGQSRRRPASLHLAGLDNHLHHAPASDLHFGPGHHAH